MFTIQQIKAAHSLVKSGADFPQYIQDIRQLGVSWYETFVRDNHTDYYGEQDFKISSEGRTELLSVDSKSNLAQFTSDLKRHQQGQTDYPAFLKDCATSGVEKWVVSLETMTCTYYDSSGSAILVENIPA